MTWKFQVETNLKQQSKNKQLHFRLQNLESKNLRLFTMVNPTNRQVHVGSMRLNSDLLMETPAKKIFSSGRGKQAGAGLCQAQASFSFLPISLQLIWRCGHF